MLLWLGMHPQRLKSKKKHGWEHKISLKHLEESRVDIGWPIRISFTIVTRITPLTGLVSKCSAIHTPTFHCYVVFNGSKRCREIRCSGILVGEALMRATDPGQASLHRWIQTV